MLLLLKKKGNIYMFLDIRQQDVIAYLNQVTATQFMYIYNASLGKQGKECSFLETTTSPQTVHGPHCSPHWRKFLRLMAFYLPVFNLANIFTFCLLHLLITYVFF